MMLDLKKLGQSFKLAFSGLWQAIIHENTFKAGVLITVVVGFFAFYLPLSYTQRAIIFLTIFSVLGMEFFNMQLERILNLIDSNHNPEIKIIKDLAAGAVLLLVIAAAIVAALIFLPHLI